VENKNVQGARSHMINERYKNKTYTKTDPEFNNVLDLLAKEYFNISGDEDAEVIINWNKREVKEDGVVSFYATNHALRNAIIRCRKGIQAVDLLGKGAGATLYFEKGFVRPMHTVLKIRK
tara:strand:- start:4668 stop:5027 length:360 start_codon:yes stop_codon:yes gene_type:complete